jgi:U3 small nucleolar RNA-associated protein 14
VCAPLFDLAMARASRPARSGRAPVSVASHKRTAKFNATGYAQRHARRASAPSAAALADVYEHHQPRSRRIRAGVDTSLGSEDVAELGAQSGDEEVDEDGPGGRRARLVGENEEEAIGSEDDEEIDSDAAFEDEDEERYAGFDFPSATKVIPLPLTVPVWR